DRSGASNSLTLDRPLIVRRAPNGYFSVNGTPTDCVHIAVTGLLEFTPDMVVSGINLGANIVDDTIYSGTVAAAAEGYLPGFPAPQGRAGGEAADAARRDRVLDRPGGRRRRRRAGDRFPCRRPLPRVADAAAHGSDAQRPAATGQEVARAVRNAAGQNRNVAGI